MIAIKKARWQAGLSKHFDAHSTLLTALLVAISPSVGALIYMLIARWIGGGQ